MQATGDLLTVVKELDRDLKRKYQVHGTRIEQIWRSLGKEQRTEVVKEGVADGELISHPTDLSLGDFPCKIMPEWNLRDLTKPDSDYLLDHLKHRATKSLFEQYVGGVYGGLGDGDFIREGLRLGKLIHTEDLPYSITRFYDNDDYGNTYTICDKSRYQEALAEIPILIRFGLCVPYGTGQLVLTRQLHLLQLSNLVIRDILEAGSLSDGNKKNPSSKPEKAAREALSVLSVDEKPEKLSLDDLASLSFDQKSDVEDFLHLLRTEPAFLSHVLNLWYYSRPALVPDEKGMVESAMTDKYDSVTFFEVVHNAIIGAAIWGYIDGLMQDLVNGPNDQVYKQVMLQELSNVCHFEYKRAQNLFKRQVQLIRGPKFFKRISGVYDDDNPRVRMRGKPDTLARLDSQLNFMLRLCQPETDHSRAFEFIKKVDRLHQSNPDESDGIKGPEFETFADLAVTTSFIQSLARSVRLPTPNPKKGQVYISKLKALSTELRPLRNEVDLSDFASPLENLEQPGMAEGALMALDRFVADWTGAEMGFLYQDLIENCLSEVQDQYRQEKEMKTQMELQTPIPEPPSPSVRIEQRREKYKTRRPHSSVYSIAPTAEEPEYKQTTESTIPQFKVRQDTFDVFTTLFKSSPESRGSIRWTEFEAAMTDLKFTILPRFGSVFKFIPSQDSNIKRPITFHRPHQSRIEGYRLLAFARRLRRQFGWHKRSFDVAS